MPKLYPLLILLTILSSAAAFAKGGLLEIEIEPIVGYERVQKLIPTQHTKDVLLYGARLTAGIPLIAAELEYTTSTDNEAFPAESLATKDVTERAKLGLVSKLKLFSLVSFKLRGGAQARRNRHEETLLGVTTISREPITYKPYLGAGLQAGLSRNLRLEADLTTIFENFPSFKDNVYQVTAGFSVKFP